MHARLIDMPDPEWLQILRDEVARPGATIAGVAASIGMKRTALSMLLSGKYPAKLDKVSAKFGPVVLDRYRDQVLCPHLRRGIGADECRTHPTAPMSTSNPVKLAQWSACRRCPLNPTKEQKNV